MDLFDGCTERNFLLRALLEQYRDIHQANLHIAFLDIEEAFPSINIPFILIILKKMGIKRAPLEIIRSLYTDYSTSMMCGGYTTKEIMMTRGVRQGCPISMLLFNICINPQLVKLETIMTEGY